MPKAYEVAIELRKLADSLELEPEAEVRKPVMGFYHWGEPEKQHFLNVARLLPRPLVKNYKDNDFTLYYDTPALRVYAKIPRKAVCRLVKPAQPAEFECDPILSAEEESAVA